MVKDHAPRIVAAREAIGGDEAAVSDDFEADDEGDVMHQVQARALAADCGRRIA